MPPHNSLRSVARSFASTTRRPTTLSAPLPSMAFPSLSSTAPKLGRVARWYLPTMALIAAGMVYLPSRLAHTDANSLAALLMESHPLDRANRTIGFAIANALEEVNDKQRRALARKSAEQAQQERNRLMLEAFGSRDSLEDMERALAMIDQGERGVSESDRNRRLIEAYGDKSSWRDVQRAMEVYEVQ